MADVFSRQVFRLIVQLTDDLAKRVVCVLSKLHKLIPFVYLKEY